MTTRSSKRMPRSNENLRVSTSEDRAEHVQPPTLTKLMEEPQAPKRVCVWLVDPYFDEPEF
jgi:hypothetical protein